MRFALLLHLDPAAASATTASEAAAEMARYAAVTQELSETGVLRGGEAFLPAQSATMVRVVNGTTVTEEPSSELARPPSDKLELSGFYIVECSEDDAIRIAARMPVATHGAVEIRPLMDLGDDF